MASGDGQFQLEELGLAAVLKRYHLSVPLNQREYAWEREEEVRKLYQDFANAFGEDADYFVGTIVTVQKGESGLTVVDGQQRLATTAILLAAIRDNLAELDTKAALSIVSDFIASYNREKGEEQPHIRLGLIDNEYFKDRLVGTNNLEPTKPSHRRIAEAFDEAAAHVANLVSVLRPPDRAALLNRWVHFLQFRAKVVLLKAPSASNAFKMFQTLNARGLRTSQSDLVKNHLFSRAGDERMEEVQQRWYAMTGALESIGDEELILSFLRHAIIVTHKFATAEQVFDQVEEIAKSQQSAVTLASSLERLSTTYVATFTREHEIWNKYPPRIRQAIETHNLLNVKPVRPLILAVAAKMDPKAAENTLGNMISWVVRLVIAGNARSGTVEQSLASAAQKVFKGEVKKAKELLAEIARAIPGDEQFQRAFATASISKRAFARYLLRSIEMVAKEESEPWLIPNDDAQAINLEHIYPQNPSSPWPGFTEENGAFLVHRLGNQALLRVTTNSDMGSKDWDSKRKGYSESPYTFTNQLGKLRKWTPEAIARRQEQLAEQAVIAWPLLIS